MTITAEPLDLRVEPGGPPASTTVTVRNKGSKVEHFTLAVNGLLAPYAQLDPPVLQVFPGTEETAQVRFVVPRAPQPAAGRVPFQIAARARVDADVRAAQLAHEEPAGPGDAAAQVEHRDAGTDARLHRQRPDLGGRHEALLPDELARRERRQAGGVQGPVERRAVVLPHRRASCRTGRRRPDTPLTGSRLTSAADGMPT
jgi:hypothetical protein